MKQTVEEAAMQELMSSYAIVVKGEFAYQQQAMLNMFRKGVEWQAKQSPWISVEDAIPNKQAKGMCQVKYVDGSIDEMAMREVNKWIYPYIKTGYVTHWRPIPSFDEILEANKDVLERIKEIRMERYRIVKEIRYNGCIPIVVYFVQVRKDKRISSEWVNVKRFDAYKRAKELLDVLNGD